MYSLEWNIMEHEEERFANIAKNFGAVCNSITIKHVI